MAKFRVTIVKKNGKPVGVRAAAINGRVIVIALQDEPQQMSWYDAVKIGIPTKNEWMAIAENLDAVKIGIPTKNEWMAIAENLDAVNEALVRAGGEPLKKSWYWSSSEYVNEWAWGSYLNYSYGLDYYSKIYYNYVRPVLAL